MKILIFFLLFFEFGFGNEINNFIENIIESSEKTSQEKSLEIQEWQLQVRKEKILNELKKGSEVLFNHYNHEKIDMSEEKDIPDLIAILESLRMELDSLFLQEKLLTAIKKHNQDLKKIDSK